MPGGFERAETETETEAEAVAYIAYRKLGIDGESSEAFSPAYIAGWMGQKGADFQTAFDRAVKAADTTEVELDRLVQEQFGIDQESRSGDHFRCGDGLDGGGK